MTREELIEQVRGTAQRVFAPLRAAYDGLNPRERTLVTLLGAVFGAIALFLPLYLVLDAITEMETENQDLVAVLRELNDSAVELETKRLEREQSLARYQREAPPLGTFIESAAQVEGLSLREVTDQPALAMGDYSRRQVRVSLTGVNLRPAVKMLSAIERSDYPVSIQRIQIDHVGEGDKYNFQIGISAYDRVAPAAAQGAATQ